MGHVLNKCQGSSKTPSYWQLLVIWIMQSFPSWVKCLSLPLQHSTPIGITVTSAPVSSLKVTGCPLSCKVTNQESFLPVLLSARLRMYTASNISELSKNTSSLLSMTYTQPGSAQVFHIYYKLHFLQDNYCDHVGTLSHSLDMYFVSHVIAVLTSVLPVVLLLYVKADVAVYHERLHQCWQARVVTD